jgi:hypothetical protein
LRAQHVMSQSMHDGWLSALGERTNEREKKNAFAEPFLQLHGS